MSGNNPIINMMKISSYWKEFRVLINGLPFKIFALFLLLFLLLMMIAFIIPSFDKRAMQEIPSEEFLQYQKETSLLEQDKQLVKTLTTGEKTGRGLRPVLVNSDDKIIGARDDERHIIQNFFVNVRHLRMPVKKLFYDLEIAGPFPLKNNDKLQDAAVYFVRYTHPQSEMANFIFDNPLAIIILLMMLISPLLWWLVDSIGTPIKKLQDAADKVAQGNFKVDKDLEITGVSEVRQVGESFNRMAEAIEDLISARQSLLYAISHELRTPLTRLQLSLSLLRRKVGDTTEVKRIQAETERLDKMIRDLLSLSHQHLKRQLFREIIPINEVWDDVMNNARFEAGQLKIICTYKRNIFNPAQYKISANRESIASALENIVRNALKYAKKRVDVTEYLGNGYFFICIDDDGEGVPPNEYENIFKPFYRVDPDNPNRKEGTGLGLSIVNNVAQQHRGNVWAESSPLGGLRITLQLPLHKTA